MSYRGVRIKNIFLGLLYSEDMSLVVWIGFFGEDGSVSFSGVYFAF